VYAATSPCNSHRKLATSTDGLQTTLELAAQQLQSTASKKRVDYVQDDQSLRSACLFKQTFFCSIHILSFVCAPALFSSLLSTKPTLVSPHKGAAYFSLFSSLSLSLLSPSLTQCCTGGGWVKRALTSAAHCISAPPNKNTDKPINNQMHHEEFKNWKFIKDMIAFFSLYNIRLVFKTFSLISIENTAAFNHRDMCHRPFFHCLLFSAAN